MKNHAKSGMKKTVQRGFEPLHMGKESSIKRDFFVAAVCGIYGEEG